MLTLQFVAVCRSFDCSTVRSIVRSIGGPRVDSLLPPQPSTSSMLSSVGNVDDVAVVAFVVSVVT